jgi:hypothetical protein
MIMVEGTSRVDETLMAMLTRGDAMDGGDAKGVCERWRARQ